MRKEKVYISGKITGVERKEYLARFRKAEQLVRERGYATVNPTRFLVCRWRWLYWLVGYELTMLYDLWRLWHCDRIYLIPGWMESRGARMESFTAYVMRVRRIPQDIKEAVDKRMTGWMEDNGFPVPTDEECKRKIKTRKS